MADGTAIDRTRMAVRGGRGLRGGRRSRGKVNVKSGGRFWLEWPMGRPLAGRGWR